MTDPAQEAAGTDPYTGGNDKPKDPPPEGAVVKLAQAGDDNAQNSHYAGTMIITHVLPRETQNFIFTNSSVRRIKRLDFSNRP